MSILVTGSAGFIGHHVTQKLLNQGHHVVAIDSLNSYYDPQLKFDRNKALDTSQGQYEFLQVDLADRITLRKIFEKHRFDFVIHLAAQAGVRYSIENPQAYMHSNMDGFFSILDLAKEHKPKHFIYASSSSVYGMDSKQPFNEDEACDNPVSFYAATKRSNELMAAAYSNLYGMVTTALRFFTVYGPWGRPDMAPILFANAAMKGEGIKVFNNGDQKRDFTYIDDIVENVVRIMDNEKRIAEGGHQIMNIGNGSPVNLMDFIGLIEKSYDIELNKEYLPAQQGDVKVTYADTTKLESYTEFKPSTSLETGIARFVEWHKSYYGG
ncbi:NAD-dependent epimerase/dehydratase family protein [Phaeocystidibacter luteus]|uniref:NAD-dependent epimerase/dehydratase family protein n=1 Tax=Phaeocystidibacter luteus TaxID=911197 RepID=A0A6N6RJ18_9FLAO|nr:NAD-dependent epimerase/dehydratase family protein [Phaeocystidibacter luteus]KAB2814343.1 NAD-dependent epimerase/dehydratase family protein [Phaeocystidibacter luteus]